MEAAVIHALKAFTDEKKFRGKGPLSVALVVTQHAKTMGLPLDPDSLVTEGGGQVLGLGKSAVQAVLTRHGIDRVLASEGGRTSRGSLGNMREYVGFLNRLAEAGQVDLDLIEVYWVDRVRHFFAGKPFKIKLDAAKGIRMVVRDLIAQAQDRQKESGGTYYAGAVLQHLVGARLDCLFGRNTIKHNSFSTADAPSGRAGDFFIGDVAIHVTTSPGEALIDRCRDNLNQGSRPLVITLERGVVVAQELARNRGLDERIDIFEIEQFMALHLYETGRFSADGRRTALTALVERYNDIVDEVETDPSLKIALQQ